MLAHKITIYTILLKTTAFAMVFMLLFNDLSFALSPELRSKPFSDATKIKFQQTYEMMRIAGTIKALIQKDEAWPGNIMRLNNELKTRLPNGEVKIEPEIKAGALSSGRQYKYAVFRFKKENKTVEARFFGDDVVLSEDELKELGVKTADDRRHFFESQEHPALRGVWFVGIAQDRERGAQDAARVRARFEELAKVYGGKGAWTIILNELKAKIGYETPDPTYITIPQVWAKFIEANRGLVEEGNDLIRKQGSAAGPETKVKLRKLRERFVFPEELAREIDRLAPDTKGALICRSSGSFEDSYVRNLAGVFISPVVKDRRLLAQAMKEVFLQAMEVIWARGTGLRELPVSEAAEAWRDANSGISSTLSAEEGFGAVVQPFLEFDASGTAMSNFYGHTAIEAAIGDARTAVSSVSASVASYLFKKGDVAFEYNPAYLDLPHTFKLKGVEYSVEKSRDEMRKALAAYPQIDGKPSPLSPAQAQELNRVVNALEEAIGVPVDVEWGILNNKLYILQARPIIGDFRKALVEPVPELAAHDSISRTPIALGQTPPAGITANIVLFGSGVKADDIRAFENEIGDGYIRVESDVASTVGVLDIGKKARVLVDPYQGSRNAHNINLITGRIAAGEFVYCNGPALREGLLQHLDLIPHPQYNNIWVSRQKVTYFSDGLRGAFYASNAPADVKDLVTDRQYELADFHERMKPLWSKHFDEIGHYKGLWELLSKNIFATAGDYAYGIMISGDNAPSVDALRRTLVDAIRKGDIPEHGVYAVQPEIRRLKEALSNPLYPERGESRIREILDRILRLEDVAIQIARDEDAKKKVRKPRSDFRIGVFDLHDSYGAIEETFGKRQGCVVRRDDVVIGKDRIEKRWQEFKAFLETNDYDMDVVIIHIGNKDYDAEIARTCYELHRVNPQALLIVEGMLPTHALIMLQDRGVLELIDPRDVSVESVVKRIEERYARYADTALQALVPQSQPTPPAAAPQKPEQAKILLIDDDYVIADQIEKYFQEALGREYALSIAHNADEAENLGLANFNLVIYDSVFPGFDRIKDGLKKAKRLVLYTAYLKEAARDELGDDELFGRSIFIDKANSKQIVAVVKKCREDQLKDYDEQLRAWQAAQAQAKPQPTDVQAQSEPVASQPQPPKLKVLFVDDDEDLPQDFALLVEHELGQRNCKAFFANTYAQANRIIEEHGVDEIVFDISMPYRVASNARDTFYGKLKNIHDILVLTGKPDETAIRSMIGEMADKDTADRVEIIGKPALTEHMMQRVREARQKQVAAWDAAHPKTAPPAEVRMPDKPTVFIIQNASAQAEDLAEYIRESSGSPYNIITVDSVFMLERSMREHTPNVVIVDPDLDDKDELANVLKIVSAKNPACRVIITSSRAATIDRGSLGGANVLAVVETPFHFAAVRDEISKYARALADSSSVATPDRIYAQAKEEARAELEATRSVDLVALGKKHGLTESQLTDLAKEVHPGQGMGAKTAVTERFTSSSQSVNPIAGKLSIESDWYSGYPQSLDHPVPVSSKDDRDHAIRDFLTKDNAKNFTCIFRYLFGNDESLENIWHVLIKEFQHGAFLHVYQLEITLTNGKKRSVVLEIASVFGDINDLALTDVENLRFYHNKFPEKFTHPIVWGSGRTSLEMGRDNQDSLNILVAEWLGDYIELNDTHYGQSILDLNGAGRHYEPIGQIDLARKKSTQSAVLREIVKFIIETSDYNKQKRTIDFISQVCIGAGDFMFRPLGQGAFNLRMITVRSVAKDRQPDDLLDYLMGNKLFFMFVGRDHTYDGFPPEEILKGVAEGLCEKYDRTTAEEYFRLWVSIYEAALVRRLKVLKKMLRLERADVDKAITEEFMRWLRKNSGSEFYYTRFYEREKTVVSEFLAGHRTQSDETFQKFLRDEYAFGSWLLPKVRGVLHKDFADLVKSKSKVELVAKHDVGKELLATIEKDPIKTDSIYSEPTEDASGYSEALEEATAELAATGSVDMVTLGKKHGLTPDELTRLAKEVHPGQGAERVAQGGKAAWIAPARKLYDELQAVPLPEEGGELFHLIKGDIVEMYYATDETAISAEHRPHVGKFMDILKRFERELDLLLIPGETGRKTRARAIVSSYGDMDKARLAGRGEEFYLARWVVDGLPITGPIRAVLVQWKNSIEKYRNAGAAPSDEKYLEKGVRPTPAQIAADRKHPLLGGIERPEDGGREKKDSGAVSSRGPGFGKDQIYAYTVVPLENADLILRHGYYGPIRDRTNPRFYITKEDAHTRDLCRDAARKIGMERAPVVIAFKVPTNMLHTYPYTNSEVAGLSEQAEVRGIPRQLLTAKIKPGIIYGTDMAAQWEAWRTQGRLGHIPASLIDIEETYRKNRKIFNRSFPHRKSSEADNSAAPKGISSQGEGDSHKAGQASLGGEERVAQGVKAEDGRVSLNRTSAVLEMRGEGWSWEFSAGVPPEETKKNAGEPFALQGKWLEYYLRNNVAVRKKFLELLRSGKHRSLDAFRVSILDLHRTMLLGEKGDNPYNIFGLKGSEYVVIAGLEALAGKWSRQLSEKTVDAQIRDMRQALETFMTLRPGVSEIESVAASIEKFYAASMQYLLFERVNQSLFMNLVNGMLRLHGLNGIDHGGLDELDFHETEALDRLFRGKIARANPGLFVTPEGMLARATSGDTIPDSAAPAAAEPKIPDEKNRTVPISVPEKPAAVSDAASSSGSSTNTLSPINDGSVIDTTTLLVHPKFLGTEQSRHQTLSKLRGLIDEMKKSGKTRSLPANYQDIQYRTLQVIKYDLRDYGIDGVEEIWLLFFGNRMEFWILPEQLAWTIPDKKTYNTFQSILDLVLGNEREVIAGRLLDDRPQKPDYWGTWFKETGEDNPFNDYRTKIHPLMVNVVEAVMQNINGAAAGIHIIDLFGGTGNFIYDLNLRLAERYPGKHITYEHIDRDVPSLKEAQRLLGNNPDITIHKPIDITAVNSFSGIFDRQPQIVTISGGLNDGVLTKEQAVRVGRNLFEAMPPEGILIVTGRSGCLLHTQDWHDIGFDILNKSFSGGSLFILKKPVKTVTKSDSHQEGQASLRAQSEGLRAEGVAQSAERMAQGAAAPARLTDQEYKIAAAVIEQQQKILADRPVVERYQKALPGTLLYDDIADIMGSMPDGSYKLRNFPDIDNTRRKADMPAGQPLSIRSPDFRERLNRYIEGPAQTTVFRILEIGGESMLANAYGGGLKGVFWRAGAVRYFTPLHISDYGREEKVKIIEPGAGRLDLGAIFGNDDPVTVEIGYGGAELLAAESKAHPDRNYVGIDFHYPADKHAAALGIGDNARFIKGNGRYILDENFADNSLDEILIVFPDPGNVQDQPESLKEYDYRLFKPGFADIFFRKLKPGGRLLVVSESGSMKKNVWREIQRAPGLSDRKFTPLKFTDDPEKTIGISLETSGMYRSYRDKKDGEPGPDHYYAIVATKASGEKPSHPAAAPAPATHAGAPLGSVPGAAVMQSRSNKTSAAESEIREEVARIYEESLKLTPSIPDKTIICHVVTESILPAGQRGMLKTLEQEMRDEKYGEKVVALQVADSATPEEFMAKLEALKANIESRYAGYSIQFDVACPKQEYIENIRKLGIQALAFRREGDGDIVQVQGIILALRALRTGSIASLLGAFKTITGRDYAAGSADINELARMMLFILPVRKLDVNKIGTINRLIEENIKSAA